MSVDPYLPLAYRVIAVRQETADVATLDLLPVGAAIPEPAPGQFAMLYVFGVGDVPISVSGAPVEGAPLMHTLRGVGPASRAITRLRPGQELGVRGPYGTVWPVAEAEGHDVLFVAGGLGLAPLRPAVRQVLANRERYGRVSLLYGTRSPQDILYREELAGWRRMLDVQIEVTVDRADASWRGAVGVVPDLIPRACFDPASTIAMVCGPEVMMRFTVLALQAAGLPFERIFVSLERSMKCGIGLCGHCQFGREFVCKQGAVMRYDRIAAIFTVREI
jgi:NAD(P)H-flavin reductase